MIKQRTTVSLFVMVFFISTGVVLIQHMDIQEEHVSRISNEVRSIQEKPVSVFRNYSMRSQEKPANGLINDSIHNQERPVSRVENNIIRHQERSVYGLRNDVQEGKDNLVFRKSNVDLIKVKEKYKHMPYKKDVKLKIVQPLLTDMLDELRAAGYTTTLTSFAKTQPLTFARAKESKSSLNPPFVVPNVVHYVWLGTDLEFSLIHYLSFVSVNRHIQPQYIFVHGEVGPSGLWWNKVIKEVCNVYHVYGRAPKMAYSGMMFLYPAHESDLYRTEILYKFGGIYLDADVIVVKSFDPLRRFRTTMGRERLDGICNGIMLSSKSAPFTGLLRGQYESYNLGQSETWAYRSVEVPHILAMIFSSWINVEEDSLNRPNSYELAMIYDQAWDWSNNYAIHTWLRARQEQEGRNVPESIQDINCGNTTIAEIGRLALYGSKAEHCENR